jgi:poly(hydroxyalkanoate) granule-associated protein
LTSINNLPRAAGIEPNRRRNVVAGRSGGLTRFRSEERIDFRPKAIGASIQMESEMAKTLKKLASKKSDADFAAEVRESANQIWLAGLGAFSKAQEEGAKLFKILVKEGEDVQARAKKAAASALKDARGKATGAIDQATGTWGKMESVFEDRVARVLHSLNVPTKKDIDVLTKRVSELTAVTKKLADGRPKPHRQAAE